MYQRHRNVHLYDQDHFGLHFFRPVQAWRWVVYLGSWEDPGDLSGPMSPEDTDFGKNSTSGIHYRGAGVTFFSSCLFLFPLFSCRELTLLFHLFSLCFPFVATYIIGLLITHGFRGGGRLSILYKYLDMAVRKLSFSCAEQQI